nr:LytTR family DNA-binding domain-containing protein [Dorea longicatena]
MYQKIDIDEILYFSIIRRGCEIHILQNGAGKILRTRKRIEEIEAELRKEYFCRIHKSFLVNPRYITEVKKSEIKMENNEILSVSKAKRKAFEDMFAEYLSYRNQT